MSKAIKIKKCRICKEKPTVETYTTKDRSYSMYAVGCEHCKMIKTKYYDTKSEAVKAWNKGKSYRKVF